MQVIKYALALSLQDKVRFILVLTSNTLAFVIIFSSFFFVQTMVTLGNNIVNNAGGDYWVLPKGYASYLLAPPIDPIELIPLRNIPEIATLYAVQEVQIPAHPENNTLNLTEVRIQNAKPIKSTLNTKTLSSDTYMKNGVLDLQENEIIINTISQRYLGVNVKDSIRLQERSYKVKKVISDSSEQPRGYTLVKDSSEFMQSQQSSPIFGIINIDPTYKEITSINALNSKLPNNSNLQIIPAGLVSYTMMNGILTSTTDKIILLLLVMALITSLGTTTITMFTNTLNLKRHYYHLHDIGVSSKNLFSFIWAQGIVYLLPAIFLATIVATIISGIMFRQVITPQHSILPDIKLYTITLIVITTIFSMVVSMLGAVVPYYLLIKKKTRAKINPNKT